MSSLLIDRRTFSVICPASEYDYRVYYGFVVPEVGFYYIPGISDAYGRY